MNSKFTSCVSQSGKQWAHSDWGEFTIYWGSQLETVRFPTAAQSGEVSQSRAPQPGESCSHRRDVTLVKMPLASVYVWGDVLVLPPASHPLLMLLFGQKM